MIIHRENAHAYEKTPYGILKKDEKGNYHELKFLSRIWETCRRPTDRREVIKELYATKRIFQELYVASDGI